MVTSEFIDINKFVKPKRSQEYTGNGVLYSAIAKCLFPVFTVPKIPFLNGMLIRTPDNKLGQESHDNYLGLAVYYILTKNSRGARYVLWECVKHGFYMKNVPLNFKDKVTWKEKWKELMAPFTSNVEPTKRSMGAKTRPR